MGLAVDPVRERLLPVPGYLMAIGPDWIERQEDADDAAIAKNRRDEPELPWEEIEAEYPHLPDQAD